MSEAQNQQVESSEQQLAIPALPSWPVSKPGPKVTEPPAGTRRIARRTEQVVEVDYNQEQGRSILRDK